MQYILLIAEDETRNEAMSPEEAQAQTAAYATWVEQCAARGALRAGERLAHRIGAEAPARTGRLCLPVRHQPSTAAPSNSSIRSPGAIRRVIGEANEDPACLGVITWMHTFSPAKMWITGLAALRKPLLHLHTQAEAALPWRTASRFDIPRARASRIRLATQTW